MMNGLSIGEKEFTAMKQKEQMLLIFRNTEDLKNKIDSYKVHQKVQYFIMTLIGTAVIFLGKLHIVP